MESPGDATWCPDRGELKAIDGFGLNKRMADGRARYRKVCFRRRSTQSHRKWKADVTRENKAEKYRYGITEDDFARMLAHQGGLCAICRVVPGTFVDHSHETGQVRGVLCFHCDNGLGSGRGGALAGVRGSAGEAR
ncbi:endonuclease domain-containing protein [Nonomuraea sp. MTCD27]|uniref:endonuclease domain-containing protein n=1 Tax=Nonomuraea sp. MTCD27 TaxID=1676747 RepID=UPI0035BFB19F